MPRLHTEAASIFESPVGHSSPTQSAFAGQRELMSLRHTSGTGGTVGAGAASVGGTVLAPKTAAAGDFCSEDGGLTPPGSASKGNAAPALEVRASWKFYHILPVQPPKTAGRSSQRGCK